MLKLFANYKYLVFCSLYGIILTSLLNVSLFGPPGYTDLTHFIWWLCYT